MGTDSLVSSNLAMDVQRLPPMTMELSTLSPHAEEWTDSLISPNLAVEKSSRKEQKDEKDIADVEEGKSEGKTISLEKVKQSDSEGVQTVMHKIEMRREQTGNVGKEKTE